MTNSHSKKISSLAPDHSISVNGININYTSNILSKGQPTLILIHGFGASLETWTDLYPLLCKNYSVVRLDLKGAGFSSKPQDSQYGPEDQARLILAFLRNLKLTNVVLVGHSLGGGIALLTYFESIVQKDINIQGLVLVDSAGYSQPLPFFVSAVRNPITRCLSDLTSPQFRARLVLEKIFEVKAKVTPERIERYAFFLDTPGNGYALNQTAQQILPHNLSQLASQFPTINVPTLIVWGENDPVIPVENGRRFNREIRNSRLIVIPDTGHVPQEERPEEFFTAIDTFMKSMK